MIEEQWFMISYFRRKQFENRALAVAVINALGESTTEKRVTASSMLSTLEGQP